MYTRIKRYFDFSLSVLGLFLMLPIFILIAFFIKIESPGPVFFRQDRVGLNKTTFKIYKFRTMRIDAPSSTPTWSFDKPEYYITKVGKYLRRRSIDELPQLINIIKGEMSIIGPRPVIWEEIELLKERDNYGASSVLPGLTGWAQINGRDNVGVTDKARLDGEYAKNQSFNFDIKIFIGTIAYVLKMDGIVEGVVNTTKNIELDESN